MEEHLKAIYGFNNFREYQKDIINDILDKNNVFAILPTGGGKSLLYQFPATYSKKITIVVSPLISLMNDQCEFLNSKNIKSACLNSERKINYDDLKNMSIIYTTPEFISTKIELLIELQELIGLFAIDEAHCVSQWSHDFRESYQQLNVLKLTFPNIPLLAVTATATPRVLEEMYKFLDINEAVEYSLGTRRDNLAIKVLPKNDFVNCKFDEPTIIYTQTRKLAEELCIDIRSKGISCAYYHAGMKIEEKQKSHELFLKGEIMVIVATISFGMGIDKSDIRHVINYGIPTDIETYYQEIGRAGRDGLMSKATIYYGDSDFATAKYLISRSSDPNQVNIKTDALNTFRRYLKENIICRQQIIDYYFEKGKFPTEKDVKHISKCKICDNCCGNKHSNMQILDIKDEAKFIVNYIKNFYNKHQYSLGMEKLSKVIRSECGLLNIKSIKMCRDMIQTLITKNILSQNNIGNGRYVIGVGSEKLIPSEPVNMYVEKCVNKKSSNEKMSFEDICAIRNSIANKYKINPTTFMNDKVLLNILNKSPKTLPDLWAVDGVSQDFIMSYGDEFLQGLKFSNSFSVSKSPTVTPASAPKPLTAGDTRMVTYNLYKQGKSISEISTERSIKSYTIEGHILDIWEKDDDAVIDLEYADLSEEKRTEILKVIKVVGTDKLRPIKDLVGNNITYFQIRLTILLEKFDTYE